MFSHRTPSQATPNAWTQQRARWVAAGRPLLDLADWNPTQVGLSPSEQAASALARVSGEARGPEPLGMLAARTAIAERYAERAIALSPGHVVLTSSTSESYAHLFRLLVNPGEAVLAPTPGYPLFEPLARAEGIEFRRYRLAFDGHWHLDRASLEAAVALGGARALIVVEPSHPCGSILSPADRGFIEELAVEHSLAIISDEVFTDFPRFPARDPLPSWLGERRALTFVLGGLSKSCGLPHLKLGWIATCGPSLEVGRALHGLEWLADLFLSVGTPVQAALPELLGLRARFVFQASARLAANAAALEQLCEECPAISVLPADGGWSAVLRLPATLTEEAWALVLLERGVAMHPGHFYDLEGGVHLVVSLIVEPRVFADACHVLGLLVDERVADAGD